MTVKSYVIIGVIFIIALCFRLWLTGLYPQPFVYDQTQYESYATKMYYAPWMLASHSFRSYPFPLLLALTYKAVGLGNHGAVFVLQAIIDSITAILLFFIVREVTGRSITGSIAAFLYAVNPFTSGFIGTISSETLSTFFIAAMVLTGTRFVKKPTTGLGILLGLCAGMSIQTRNAMTIGSLITLFTVFLWVKWKNYKIAFLGITIGVLVTAIYPLYTNWRDYREITPFKVDSFYAMEFYNGATLKILPPFTQSWQYPRQQQIMWSEYWSEDHPGRTTAQRSAMAMKYIRLGWEVVRRDPWDYIRWRFYKMWYVWQKQNIFPITEPDYNLHEPFTYWGNIVILGLAILGAVAAGAAKKNRTMVWLWTTMVGVIVSQTFAFAFSHAESRLTLPLYPIIMIFAAFGLKLPRNQYK